MGVRRFAPRCAAPTFGEKAIESVGGPNPMAVKEWEPELWKGMRKHFGIRDDILSGLDMKFKSSGGKGGDMLAFYSLDDGSSRFVVKGAPAARLPHARAHAQFAKRRCAVAALQRCPDLTWIRCANAELTNCLSVRQSSPVYINALIVWIVDSSLQRTSKST
eukprot:SAG31_NODE_4152_length_3527_cov_22.835764_2_plen_162_part_00